MPVMIRNITGMRYAASLPNRWPTRMPGTPTFVCQLLTVRLADRTDDDTEVEMVVMGTKLGLKLEALDDKFDHHPQCYVG
jgi:hypothetical protein